ncbi:sterile alpha motif domain-containing protein 15-like [Syngnathoides biaculeatus]|uniref:sterile alpha motif domain-containing protein 15-like n=1 Tax=Syngnathoides biaculeatus TaxID=300417 RepID=UPI002ADDA112|nr:sterile alpha motif domain-containing protein 15-like [Syngnathoides biaculeatus]
MGTPNMAFLQWTCEDVARWIESIGFPQYTLCFTENCVTGRKLIFVDCAHMPRLGITDFKHMQAIAARVRELLGIGEVLWSRSIADPPRDPEGLFLEMKSRTGVKTDELTPQQLLEDIRH